MATRIAFRRGSALDPADDELLAEETASVTTVDRPSPSGSEAINGNTNLGYASPVVELPSRTGQQPRGVSVAVLLPCKDEVATITKVVNDFRTALPGASVYVYDNASIDGTADAAARAGAVVRFVPEPGKGNVIRRMFAEVEADVYVVADGDDTYDASRSPELVELLTSRSLDMVVGSRVVVPDQTGAYPRGHRFGNSLFNTSVKVLFGDRPADMLTGYRVFSRRFAKSFPCMSTGFDVETELTLHAMDLRLPVAEVATDYRERAHDSNSKLRTVTDGFKILGCLLGLFHSYKPMRFYGTLALASALVAAVCGVFARISLHPWSVLSGVFAVSVGLAVIFALLGVSLSSVRRGQREVKRMIYLASRTSAPDTTPVESVDGFPRMEQHIPKQIDVARGQPGGSEILFDLATTRGAEPDC